jgi:hypothetical protein
MSFCSVRQEKQPLLKTVHCTLRNHLLSFFSYLKTWWKLWAHDRMTPKRYLLKTETMMIFLHSTYMYIYARQFMSYFLPQCHPPKINISKLIKSNRDGWEGKLKHTII